MVKRKVQRSNSLLFMQFLAENKFNPENYYKILELIQSVPNSLSQYLTGFGQFLLSEKVDYQKLEENDIKGAHGHLTDTGIYIPKSNSADNYFLRSHVKIPYKRHGYAYPNMSDVDSIILYVDNKVMKEDLEQIKEAILYPVFDKYLGFITTKEEKEEKLYQELLQIINQWSREEYLLSHEEMKDENKEFYLIRKK